MRWALALSLCLVARATAAEPAPAPARADAEPAGVEAAAPAAPAEAGAKAVARALARFEHEPGVDRVVAAALEAMGADPGEALASRARAAGWVPQVTLKVRRGQAVDLTDASGATDGLRLSTDDDLTLGARLTFHLDRVVFRREEVALSRESRAREEARRKRAREVVRLYFLRRRLQVEGELGAPGALQRALRIAELEAILDAFTNGAFQRMMDEAQERAP